MNVSRVLLNQILNTKSSIFILGPRGVGKTALADQLLDSSNKDPESLDLRYDLLLTDTLLSLTADPSILRSQILSAAGRASSVINVLIDEIQLAPSLLNEVHYLIEKLKDKVRFILTGSSARKLKRSGSNLLAGRAINFFLHPLNLQEIELNLLRALQFGTLPKPYLSTEDPIPFLMTYVDTYLKEEVKQEAIVRKYEAFIRFLDLAAQLNGENINFTKLGRQIGVAATTVESYYSILEDTLLVLRIDGWFHSVKKQMVTGPKYYFYDCGVLNALRRELHLAMNPSSFRFGKLFESFMIQQIRSINDYLALNFRLNYWRTNTGTEVDLILTRSQYDQPIAIEFKASNNPDLQNLNGLVSFRSEYPDAKSLCICTTDKQYSKNNIEFLPWQMMAKYLKSLS